MLFERGKMAEKEVQQQKMTETSKKTPDVNKKASQAGGKTPVSTASSALSAEKTAGSRSKGDLNKEVLLVLQELNSNMESQRVRLEKQDKRIDEVFASMKAWEPEEYPCEGPFDYERKWRRVL